MSYRGIFTLFLSFWMVSCGNSNFETAFREASESQNRIDNNGASPSGRGSGGIVTGPGGNALLLWERSPTRDSGNLSVHSNSSLLDSLALSPVRFFNLLSFSSGLNSQYIQVFRSFSNQNAPSLDQGLDNRFDRHSSEFKSYMAYAHLSRTIEYMKGVFPDLSFNGDGKDIFPLFTYAAQPGNSLNTQYLGEDGEGTIIFFQNDSGDAERFNPVDEADAIAHEFGHALQHALNLEVMETPGNYDMDMLLEALADLYAASYLKDPFILSYLESNAQFLFGENDRISNTHKRSVENRLFFPDAYLDHFHLDGRVVTGAFNDLRKLLEGRSVDLLQCRGSCQKRWSGDTLSSAEAFDRILRISHMPLRAMIPTSSLRSYIERVLRDLVLDESMLSGVCSTQACRLSFRGLVEDVFEGRGLYDSRGHVFTGPMIAGETNSSQYDLMVSADLGVMSFPGPLSGFSNENGEIDPCELLFVYPNFKNNTDRSNNDSAFYDISFQVIGANGFFELPSIEADSLYPDSSDDDINASVKTMGMLLPGETTTDLVGHTLDGDDRFDARESRIYTPQLGSALTQYVSQSFFPSPIGWIVKAPRSKGSVGSLNIRLTLRPLNSNYNNTSVRRTFQFTQSLTVEGDSEEFSCSS